MNGWVIRSDLGSPTWEISQSTSDNTIPDKSALSVSCRREFMKWPLAPNQDNSRAAVRHRGSDPRVQGFGEIHGQAPSSPRYDWAGIKQSRRAHPLAVKRTVAVL